MKSLLDGVTVGSTVRGNACDPVVAETDEEILARAIYMCVNLHVTDWVATQWEDLLLKAVINWIPNQKVQDLKHLLGDDVNTVEGMAILQEWKKLMLYQGALYHCHTSAGKLGEVMWFVVPTAH